MQSMSSFLSRADVVGRGPGVDKKVPICSLLASVVLVQRDAALNSSVPGNGNMILLGTGQPSGDS